MKNIKNFLLITAIAFIATNVNAQTSVESIIIQKHNRNAVKLEINQPEQITQTALDQRFKRSGLKGKTSKGVTLYKGVTLSEISISKLDIYTRVVKHGTGSIVYMAASKGYDNFAGAEDTEITANIEAFLNAFVNDANYRSVDVDLSAQMDDIAKQEKAYQKLLEDQKDTEKKKADAEAKLIQIQNELDSKKTELDLKKANLEELKNKRTTINQQ
ncbi:MAG TPA: hypothetical protein PK431_00355 [Chitinophagales bacterium]|nr:hypothetical protein [Chitinophagales bacterium]